MRRLLTLVLLVSVLLGAFVFPANAALRYCSNDPVFNVNGHEVSVLVELAPYDVGAKIKPWNPVVTVLWAPRGTNPYVQAIVGNGFPERAYAREWGRQDVGVFVRVPYVREFEEMRVTISVDGVQVKQVSTTHRMLFTTIPW